MSQDPAQSVLAAVRAELPGIAASATAVDRLGAVDPGVLARLAGAGYFALLQPISFGGLEADPNDHLTATRELSRACTSTGWLAGMFGAANWHLALFDARAQADVWESDPHALLCTSYAPTGRLEKVDGGYLLSGQWHHCTGVVHASWLMAGAIVIGPDGAAEDFLVALVPRRDYTIESNWNGAGLRGIGAGDVAITRALVPHHRAFGWVSPDQRAAMAPLFRLPQPTMYTHTGTAPLLGAAAGALDMCPPEEPRPLGRYAMTRADLDLSVLQMQRNLAELMDCARGGADPDDTLMLRSRRDQVVACERAIRAVRLAIRTVASDADHDVVHRLWRDVQTARIHAANNTEQVLTMYGRFAFGLSVDDLMW